MPVLKRRKIPLHAFIIDCVRACTQVGIDGLISIGEDYNNNVGTKFPIEHRVIAPYWDDIDTEMQGRIEYKVFYESSDGPLGQVNDYFIDRTDVSFQASRILVFKWIDVCAKNDEKCINESVNVSGYFTHKYRTKGM